MVHKMPIWPMTARIRVIIDYSSISWTGRHKFTFNVEAITLMCFAGLQPTVYFPFDRCCSLQTAKNISVVSKERGMSHRRRHPRHGVALATRMLTLHLKLADQGRGPIIHKESESWPISLFIDSVKQSMPDCPPPRENLSPFFDPFHYATTFTLSIRDHSFIPFSTSHSYHSKEWLVGPP